MDNVFNIIDFGAAADEKTDCTKPIQEAIDKAAKVKGAVVIPPGKYMCGYIKMKPGVNLIGFHGWGYRETGGSVLILNTDKVPCLLDITDAFGCKIQGIQFKGNKRKGKNIHGIMFNHKTYNGGKFDEKNYDDNPFVEPTHADFREDNFIITDCQIKLFSGDGIHLNHIFAFTVSECQIMYNSGDGIYINGWDGWIYNCIIAVNDKSGIGSCKNDKDGNCIIASITITGNRIEWNKTCGIHLVQSDSLNINSNFFDRSGGPAIKLNNKNNDDETNKNITITGNIFKRDGKENFGEFYDKYDNSHVYIKNGRNIVVTSNSFIIGQDDGNTGKFTPDYSIVCGKINGCVVTSNAMNNGSIKQGIVLLHDDILNNIIKDNSF